MFTQYTDSDLLKQKVIIANEISRFNNEQMAFKIAMNSLN